MRSLIELLNTNRPLTSAILAWFLAQVLKTLTWALVERKFDWRRLIETGGLPSAHAAITVGLITGIGLSHGLHTVEFAIAFVFGSVVIYDAMGIRREAGRHADLLNELLTLSHIQEVLKDRAQLKALLGHTPFEVIAGALLGLGVAIGIHTLPVP
jgi:uncharacterized protein